MAQKALMRTALWTEIREALLQDFPALDVPLMAPPALTKVIQANADYILELSDSKTHTI